MAGGDIGLAHQPENDGPENEKGQSGFSRSCAYGQDQCGDEAQEKIRRIDEEHVDDGFNQPRLVNCIDCPDGLDEGW